MSLTPAQQQAIAARGNVLVVAGAGTGKTRTLVERCLHCLLHDQPAVSLDQMLLVTFTEAAAAEMRQRIRAGLEQQLDRQPDSPHWQEQLALFDTALIGTLHSFCLKLIRQHFYELELDPQLTVLAEEESRLLAEETLDEVLQRHYAGQSEISAAVLGLIQSLGHGADQPVRALVLKLHHYTQTLPDPAAWFAEQMAVLASPEPRHWEEWFLEAIILWREEWLAECRNRAGRPLAAECAALLQALVPGLARPSIAGVLDRVKALKAGVPPGKRTQALKPWERFFEEAQFLLSVAQIKNDCDPLQQDWNWVRHEMLALLRLAREFQSEFTAAKRELGTLDFHDLEQYALQLLWNKTTGQPSAIALEWRKKLRFVYVDEYQDINAAQDRIVEALGREGAEANRFLVGDVKQSIYRFRLANPYIFQRYATAWRGERGSVIPLTDNFRSREAILEFVNSLFALLMPPDAGPIAYDDQARLRFGSPEKRAPLSLAADSRPGVELHVRLKSKGRNEGQLPEADEDFNRLDEPGKEARLLGMRLRELHRRQQPVWDGSSFRPVQWSDMAVLLRSPAHKAESYAREFARLGVPLVVARGGFYETLEISDLLSLLQLLDNPLQDVPAIAVVRSPLVGLTFAELAAIRLAAPRDHFWTALQRWHELQLHSLPPEDPAVPAGRQTFRVVHEFLARFQQWRRLSRQVSLSRCLESILAETHYEEWLLSRDGGVRRQANVRQLVELTRQFDQFQRQGLFRFLRFVQAQQDAETAPDIARTTDDNAVKLMSIHQSKGLEFPIVALADLAKPFNFSDLYAELILDERYGLCPQIKPPQTGRRYPSLAHWLARRRQKQETLQEELRLLYVALTRACDRLILSASLSEERFTDCWTGEKPACPAGPLTAGSYADWLALWFSRNCIPDTTRPTSGTGALVEWTAVSDEALRDFPPAADVSPDSSFHLDDGAWKTVQERLAWRYPFGWAAQYPAKTSVSTLRQEAAQDGAVEDALELFPQNRLRPPSSRTRPPKDTAQTAADRGVAHHKFLQWVSLDRVGSLDELRKEVQRLEREGTLSSSETALLDLKALTGFWGSEIGRRVRQHAGCVRRELPFTARFSPQELAELTGFQPSVRSEHDFVVVQGVADLVVMQPAELWLLDFKTDQVPEAELDRRIQSYEPQLLLYALALSRIWRRPVTHCWLHFLALNRIVALAPGPARF